MPIPLPDLDDRTFADFVEEARTMIPGLAPGWTDHNPSDPGITLVELFAHLAEMMVYRTNQVPDANLRVFLKLLDGGAGDLRGAVEPGGAALDDALRRGVLRLRERERAVTRGDYETLALETFNAWLAELREAEAADSPDAWFAWLSRVRPQEAAGLTAEQAWAGREAWWAREWWGPAGLDRATDPLPSGVRPVERAFCVPRRNLNAGTEAERTAAEPGHLSLVVLPRPAPPTDADALPSYAGLAPDWPLRRALWSWLDPRRMLTTRHHVVGPTYVPVRVRVRVMSRPDVPEAQLGAVQAELERFFDPLRGGVEGGGRAFGRDVYASELYAALERLPLVDHVPFLELLPGCEPGERGCVAAPELRSADGRTQVGLAMAQHHLPLLRVVPGDVQVSTHAVPVRVAVEATRNRAVDEADARRDLRAAAERYFAQPAGGYTVAGLRTELRRLAAVNERQAVTVRFDADPAHLATDDSGAVTGLRLSAREMAEVRVSLDLR
ncbi:MAG: hypothetical protein AB1941_22025 [Gemmatimonadota bacterium]